MRDLRQYLTEASDDFKRFKIDDLMYELEINEVSKSRRNEIVKFYKQILGDGPYYCVSRENPESKSIKIIDEIKEYGYWSPNDRTDDENWNEYVDKQLAAQKDHNDWINSLSNEQKKKFEELSKIKGLRLPKGAFKFGYTGTETYLEGCIVFIDGDFVPCIKQDVSRVRNMSDFNLLNNCTFYFAEKDIK